MTLIKSSNAIIAYEGRLTAVVEVILNHVVSSGTHTNYAKNSDLILWIYKKDEWREALLRDCMVEILITAEAEGKKAIHTTCKAELKAIKRNDNNCPIIP